MTRYSVTFKGLKIVAHSENGAKPFLDVESISGEDWDIKQVVMLEKLSTKFMVELNEIAALEAEEKSKDRNK